MKTNIAKHYFDTCHGAYVDTEKRKAFPFPDWLQQIKNDQADAQEGFISLQSALLMILQNQGDVLKSYPDFFLPPEVELQNFFDVMALSVNAREWQTTVNPLASAMRSLAEYIRFTSGKLKPPTTSEAFTAASLHQLAAQAVQRDPRAVTPIDVAEFMASWAGTSASLDVYGLDGLGLLYGARKNGLAQLVGDEFAKGTERLKPQALKKIYNDSRAWYRGPEFINAAFMDFEWLFGTTARQGEALLVNATRVELPFFDLGSNDHDTMTAGMFNRCLTAGYKKVVALVANHYLTAGQGVAGRILQHCLKHGLTHVIQLPMGTLGFRSQQHSVLVFENLPKVQEVHFIDYSNEANIRSAEKGFGYPRRAVALINPPPEGFHTTVTVPVDSINGYGKVVGKHKKLLSFEVGQFSKLDALESLRRTSTFMHIHEFMDVFRAHHIEENDDPTRAEFVEIGTSSINEYGWISQGKARNCPSSSLRRREAQILKDKDIVLCFRGSPDSFGKVGFYRKKPTETAVPNQSFVILRRKEDAGERAPAPELLFWWLCAQRAQSHLRLKSISPDVMRISPRDIAELEVPVGPPSLIETERKKVDKALAALDEMAKIADQIKSIGASAWQQL